jgi:ATP-dependent DNA helicase RecQ
MFETQDELAIFAKHEERIKVIDYLEQKRLGCLVATLQQIQNVGYFNRETTGKPTYIVGPLEIKELLKNNNYYYISGVVAVLYPDYEDEIYEVFKLVNKYLRHKAGIHVVHILTENTYFDIVGKGIADLIEGRVVTAEVLCS